MIKKKSIKPCALHFVRLEDFYQNDDPPYVADV